MVRVGIIFFIISLFVSCGYRVITVDGQTTFKNPPKRQLDFPDGDWHQFIDSNAVYISTQEYSTGTSYKCFKFGSNGRVMKTTKIGDLSLTEEDFQLPEKSVYLSYFWIDKERIKIECFFPEEPNPFTNYWQREIFKGKIHGDTIELKLHHKIYNYVKSNEFHFD